MTTIASETKIKRDENRYLPGALGDGYMLMDKVTGHYITLNLTAAKIWEMAVAAITVEEVIVALIADFNVDKALCTADTIECVTGMVETGVLTIAD